MDEQDEGPEGHPSGAEVAEALTHTPEPMAPPTMSDYLATAALMLAFVVTMLLAIAFAPPAQDAGLQAFEDTGDPLNIVFYIFLLIGFTVLILWLNKRGHKWAIQAVILLAIGSTVMYMFAPLLLRFGLGVGASWGIGAVIGGGSVLWLFKHPEWYVVDLVGVLVASAAASIFGISLEPWLVVLMLVALAVYDAIAVYKTRHMLSLADSVIELRLPVLLVIPKHRNYSFLREAAKFKEASSENKEEREAFFMGLGDLVMPTILVVSALTFGFGTQAVLGAAVGTLVGFAVLMGYVLKGNPQAGLPLLNGGAIVGFIAGVYATTGSVVFW